ncbi:MAG: methyltransferase [Spirochaetes bacterium GWF1_51_8]|nr:MAG: methyltransferase [Spirochaetes bacterium GWF1_51_8]
MIKNLSPEQQDTIDLNTLDNSIPKIAKDAQQIQKIEEIVKNTSTTHYLYNNDSTKIDFIPNESTHLVVTSPPYWTLKTYNDTEGQLGHIEGYNQFLDELDKVWKMCFDALVPGGRLVCVVGDVCLSRRKNHGEHTVIPLHASIQERCRMIGYSNLSPIIWHKISNASYEVKGNKGFLGKPYEPNGIIKNDIEYILMLRKPGGYRNPSKQNRVLSIISEKNHREWFQQIWDGITGESTKKHPAPYPIGLAERLIRMFSFVGDTVLDPFMGTGTTNLAASNWGRNSIGIELDNLYYKMAINRMNEKQNSIFNKIRILTECENRLEENNE